jgi:hypothetical protein
MMAGLCRMTGDSVAAMPPSGWPSARPWWTGGNKVQATTMKLWRRPDDSLLYNFLPLCSAATLGGGGGLCAGNLCLMQGLMGFRDDEHGFLFRVVWFLHYFHMSREGVYVQK